MSSTKQAPKVGLNSNKEKDNSVKQTKKLSSNIPKEKRKQSCKEVEIFEFQIPKDDKFMPNFSENYQDLINEIKSGKIQTHKNLSNNYKIEGEPIKIQPRSYIEPVIGASKVENLITAQKNEKAEADIKRLTNIEEIRDFYDYTENCLKLISGLVKPSEREIESLMIDLPAELTVKKKLAIFDLDETLIHCVLKDIKLADRVIQVKLPTGKKANIGLNIRPHIDECLKEIKKKYHLIIYTASDQSYADSVLDFIDPLGEYFSLRLYRHNCVKAISDGNTLYIKDLRIIRNVKLKNILIIDNSVLSFAFHLDNGIPILPYYSNKKDREMLFLKDYLMNLSSTEDFRNSNGKIFNLKVLLKETIHEESPQENSPKDEDSAQSASSEEEVFSIDDHEKLDKMLNKPVRRESKFQQALSETLHNARKNIINIIKDAQKEDDNEEEYYSKRRVSSKLVAGAKSKSNNSVINLKPAKRCSQMTQPSVHK